jgi:negative regulator of sigma E activity
MTDLPGTDSGADRSMLSGYLDGELSVEEIASVEAQLVASAEWRAELDEVRVARAAVRGLEVHVAPAGFWARVEEAVNAAGDATPNDVAIDPIVGVTPIAERRERQRHRVGWIAGGVAAAVIAGAMFVIPGRDQVRPNVTAVATQHAASSSDVGDPISGLVPLGPMRASP